MRCVIAVPSVFIPSTARDHYSLAYCLLLSTNHFIFLINRVPSLQVGKQIISPCHTAAAWVSAGKYPPAQIQTWARPHREQNRPLSSSGTSRHSAPESPACNARRGI